MKIKGTKVVLIAVLGFFVLLAMRLSGILGIHSIGSANMEPNYPVDSNVFSSNLLSPNYNKVVVYESEGNEIPGFRPAFTADFLGRLIAKENDVIELKDGQTYINGNLQNPFFDLNFRFKLNAEQIKRNRKTLETLKPTNFLGIRPPSFNESYLSVFLPLQLKQTLIDNENFILEDSSISDLDKNKMAEYIQDSWTTNNYGPLTIPKDHVFILGDSRANSVDSRYRGFIHVDKVKAVLLY